MMTPKILDQNKKVARSCIPVRCNINAGAKKSLFQAKPSSQLTVPSENKQVQGGVIKVSKVNENFVNKPNRLPITNPQAVENLKSNEHLKTEVKQAKKVQPEPLKLSNKSTKPVPVHKRNLSSANKEAKSHVKSSQVQPQPLKLNNRTTKSVLQRNISSVNTLSKETKSYNVNKSKSQGPLPQDVKSQNKPKPFKKTQSSGEEKFLKPSTELKQSKKDEKDFKNQSAGFHRAVDRPSNAHKLAILTSSMMSNKENLNTRVVEELKQITEKRRNKLKEEGLQKIQPVSQMLEINEELMSKTTESVLTQSVVEEKENKLACSTKNDYVVSDSEFENSKFFKSLILSEKDRSPCMMTLVPEIKVSTCDDVVSKSPSKMFLKNYATEDDFVEDLRRNSAKYRMGKGLSPHGIVKSPSKKYLESFPSVDDFVENLRRNSAILIRTRATLQGSPHLIGNNHSSKKFPARFTAANEIMQELRRNSANFIKRRGKVHLSPSQITPYSRRWTCNVQNSSVKNLPLVREESRFQMQTKIVNSVCKNPVSLFNIPPSALKGSETLKKKDKSKKKVTFYISPTNSSESASLSEKSESNNLKTISLQIPKQPSQNSTPEFEGNVYRNKENPVVLEYSTKTRNSSTPEFNFEALKILPSSFTNASKNDEDKEHQIGFTPMLEVKSLECSNNKITHDSKFEKANISCFQPFASSLSCKSPIKDFKSSLHSNQNSIHSKIADCKNSVKENAHRMFSRNNSFVSEGQTAIIRPMQQLSISSCNNINETGPFSVKTGIVTPYSFSNSYLVSSLSPPILVDRPSILASYAPICTPLVLKNVSQNSDLNPVRQKLDFEEVKLERRESLICLQDVPTLQKMQDYLCDQECCMLSLLSSETLVLNRNMSNPIAEILSNGDEMHFVPLNSFETEISP